LLANVTSFIHWNGNLQSAQSEDTEHQPLPSPAHLHPHNHTRRHRQDNNVERNFARAANHPEQVVIETVAWISKAVDPAPLQRDAVGEGCDCATNPPSDHQKDGDVELHTEGIGHVEYPLVHEENCELGSGCDGKVEDRGCEGEFEVEHIVIGVDVACIGIFGNPEAVGRDAVCLSMSVLIKSPGMKVVMVRTDESHGRSRQCEQDSGEDRPVIYFQARLRKDASVESQTDGDDSERDDEPTYGKSGIRFAGLLLLAAREDLCNVRV
jgi:hypothetical protein